MKYISHKKVAITILNWNGKADTIECFESLKHITYPSYEILLVDNGSSDGYLHAGVFVGGRLWVTNANNNYINQSRIEDWMLDKKFSDANSVESLFWASNIFKNTKGNYSNLEVTTHPPTTKFIINNIIFPITIVANKIFRLMDGYWSDAGTFESLLWDGVMVQRYGGG